MIKSKKKFRTTQDNENMTIQNLWDTVKAVFRRNSIMIEVFLKKKKKERKKRKSQINHLTSYLKELGKNKNKISSQQMEGTSKGHRENRDFFYEEELIKPRACSLKG